jgi:Flp pilus assembly protein TadG
MKVNAILILWRRFRADRRGNIAMIAALSILGLVGSAGLGIDYYNALAAKTRLDLASDAAAIAAINAAQSYIEANSATQTDPALSTAAEAAGEAQALKVFNSNAGSTAKIAATPTITISRTGQTFNATITYQATSQNAFGPIFGYFRSEANQYHGHLGIKPDHGQISRLLSASRRFRLNGSSGDDSRPNPACCDQPRQQECLSGRLRLRMSFLAENVHNHREAKHCTGLPGL